MLRRAGLQALRALLELAQEPSRWRSVQAIAAAQQLPAPMLEQLLIQLRRAGVLEAPAWPLQTDAGTASPAGTSRRGRP